jgi:type II secretory pathway component PulL
VLQALIVAFSHNVTWLFARWCSNLLLLLLLLFCLLQVTPKAWKVRTAKLAGQKQQQQHYPSAWPTDRRAAAAFQPAAFAHTQRKCTFS